MFINFIYHADCTERQQSKRRLVAEINWIFITKLY